MYKLIYLKQAKEDLIHIYNYIKTNSSSQVTAKNFVKKLQSKCLDLSKIKGEVGVARSKILKGLRSFPYKNYVIFFRYQNKSIEIITIIEGHKDIEKHFQL